MAEKVKPVFSGDVSKGRLEFLFDGVFAIAMTILVLELKLPELSTQEKRSAGKLGIELLRNWRTFLSYIMSFFILSGFWIGHNPIYERITRISKSVVAVHVWLLAWAAFVPFCAHLLGRYPGNQLAFLIYFGTAFCYVLGLLVLIILADRQKLFAPDVTAADVRKLRRGFMRPLIGMLIIFLYAVFIMPALR